MAGIGTATLTAWVIPVQMPVLNAMADHTYVSSSCGLVWPCWGRSAGGKPHARGQGSSAVADCLSQVNSQAGLRYGITGVCHQAANRILHPATTTVAGCSGYPLSQQMFGVYGHGAWPQLGTCYTPSESSVIGAPQPGGADMHPVTEYNRDVAGHLDSAAPEQQEARELAALLRLGLGRDPEPGQLRDLLAIQRDIRRRQAALAERLDAGRITEAEYLHAFRDLCDLMMAGNRRVLGVQECRRVFGDSPPATPEVVDPETFLREQSRERALHR